MVKPDVLYPGGDYAVESAGMQLVGLGVGNDFYRLECRTSFAAPLATNLAAKLIRLYPDLNMHSGIISRERMALLGKRASVQVTTPSNRSGTIVTIKIIVVFG